ncbi:hypothetical protein UA08_08621 [Talaromyces atroroseus]|uniref:Uncharacterized protein n=1 Tax=Talaromyces atroroseus TaxID=1441469 RepID=A0A225ADN8_TALAT|nr:hypothetical protein UA08_08621 [Talaromyces atroroseus]OKL56064.1 hypothetical protein UA08_08621 [Talaromyces atroroseus]
MGQRHNRRRTRPRSRNQSQSRTVTANEHQQQQQYSLSEPAFLAPLAHTRHNSWLDEWQNFEYNTLQPRHSTPELAMQQYRFFGGEPGDDANLCYNMLDFFGRLDYIDT